MSDAKPDQWVQALARERAGYVMHDQPDRVDVVDVELKRAGWQVDEGGELIELAPAKTTRKAAEKRPESTPREKRA